jgi:DNA (cytosine-5)-methyltransferase 1
MEKGSGTRSGLLWEVERLLTETKNLPQVLVMENVPQVASQKNIQDFAKWIAFLDGLGYKSKWEILNAKDYGIPQNRERCFMVSILGDYYYEFRTKKPLKQRLKDMLEDSVDGKYYLSDKALNGVLNTSFNCSKLDSRTAHNVGITPYLRADGCVGALTTDGSSPKHNNRVVEPIVWDGFNQRIRSDSECLGTITQNIGADLKRNGQGIIEQLGKDCVPFRIRKITPKECWRLMGFTDKDVDSAVPLGCQMHSCISKQAIQLW